MADVALPDGDRGMSQCWQPVGMPGTGTGAIKRDGCSWDDVASKGMGVVGGQCLDLESLLACLFQPGAENGVKPLSFPSPVGPHQADAH